jgi:hypothetical protein
MDISHDFLIRRAGMKAGKIRKLISILVEQIPGRVYFG